jgi:hypothetical protein
MSRADLWPEVRHGLSLLSKRLPLSRKLAAVEIVDKITYDGEDCKGLCEIRDGDFVLLFNSGLSTREAQETLVHEWAHALEPDQKKHNRKWGIAYASAYSALIGE